MSFISSISAPHSSTSSLSHWRATLLISSLLAELSWRGDDVSSKLVQLLQQNSARGFAYPYKQVRQELGHCLWILYNNLWRPDDVIKATSSHDLVNLTKTFVDIYGQLPNGNSSVPTRNN